MGTYRHSTTAGRQTRRRATSAIAALAVTGLLAACTAASAGAIKPAPSRYWTAAGAAASAGALKQAPSGYWTAAGAAAKATASTKGHRRLHGPME